jgi:hypothetical protein
VLWGGDFALELVRYVSPKPFRPREGYRYTDRGIFNVAVTEGTEEHFHALLERVESAGYRVDWEPIRIAGVATVVYVTANQGFSVELLYVDPRGREYMGFLPKSII